MHPSKLPTCKYATIPLIISVVQPDSQTRTAVSRVRADQGVLIGRNTAGIEDGVSVSAKLA